MNGVFKGGGAKGIAYVGAIEVLETRGFRFAAVSGSSAGAITAALLAAGCTSADLRTLLPEVLRELESPFRALSAIHRRSLLRSDGLERWIDSALRRQLAAEGPVSFSDVYDATGIDLYVVAMDLDLGQPVVFSPRLSPEMPVASAVTASAAIPVAFPSYRMDVEGETVRLIDGGVWANYPHFVFLDDEFRAVHGLDGSGVRPTVGFTLEAEATPARRAISTASPIGTKGPRFTDGGSAARRLGLAGALLSSPWAKALTVAIPMLAGALLVLVSLWLARDGWQIMDDVPALVQPATLVLIVLGLSGAVLLTAASLLLAARLARSLLDEGLSGVSAAMGVGPSVPYWIGGVDGRPGVDRHAVIRIEVPDRIGTLSFRPKPAAIDEAIAAGRRAATRAIDDHAWPRRRRSWRTVPERPTLTRRQQLEAIAASLFIGMFKAIAFGFLAVLAVRHASGGRVVFLVLPLLAVGLGVGWSVRTYAKRRHARASRIRPSMRSLGLRWNLVLAVLTGAVATGFAVTQQQSGASMTVIASDGGRMLQGELFDESIPLMRLLRAEELVGTVVANDVENRRRIVTVAYDGVATAGCAAPPDEIRYPVGTILGARFEVGETFAVPFEHDTCTLMWKSSGGKPELADGLYLGLVVLALGVLALNALAAAVSIAVDIVRRRRRGRSDQV